ncbi:hypothetical protein EV385_1040 [Krasilnikovia cinnamomea]|uniref:Uncharacterized protein n=1 Tax=Krasilnikovia cinnamomea TaxID=349313 RepID=A0A4Q7ZF27_9ACTN|nr:hypothetical protein [Krasilnikovia cinnamomea]RZU49298.1 hypothetical protein EV385_1040 [Krasilnikovia cinnamomea]
MTPEAVPPLIRRTDVTARTAREIRQAELEAERRLTVRLRVTAVTLAWLVSVSLALGWGFTATPGSPPGGAFTLAAVLVVLLPFVAAVIATRHGRVWLGGLYVVLTLAMVVPAVIIARAAS